LRDQAVNDSFGMVDSNGRLPPALRIESSWGFFLFVPFKAVLVQTLLSKITMADYGNREV
jgi:hypothetical protein